MKNFNLYLFDLDDTLINTSESYLTSYQEVLKETQVKNKIKKIPLLEEINSFCRIFNSGNPQLVIENMIKFYDYPLTLNIAKLTINFWEKFWQKLKVFSGVKEYLQLLQNENKKFAIISNGKKSEQEKKMKNTQLENFFSKEFYFISENFHPLKKKPSPYMLDLAKKKFDEKKAIFYGNQDSDILAGKLANATTAILDISPINKLRTKLKPDYVFKNWQEIIKKYQNS